MKTEIIANHNPDLYIATLMPFNVGAGNIEFEVHFEPITAWYTAVVTSKGKEETPEYIATIPIGIGAPLQDNHAIFDQRSHYWRIGATAHATGKESLLEFLIEDYEYEVDRAKRLKREAEAA